MDGVKSIFASTTFWGAMVSVFGKLAALLGYAVMPEDEQVITAAISLLVSGFGDLAAVYGRVKATKKIG